MLTYFALAARDSGLFDEVVAVHINYGNRQQSDAEEEYVKDWCRHYNIRLYVRRIDEIKRGHVDSDIESGSESDWSQLTTRSFYESYTRHVRFDLYRQIGLPVWLGHNRDDCFENIFTNIIKCQHFENLKAMVPWTVGQYGVAICRPFLAMDKSTILRCSRALGLMHTKNSTPPWSVRYKLRNGIINDVIKRQPDFLVGLERLNDTLANYMQREKMEVERILDSAEDQSGSRPSDLLLGRESLESFDRFRNIVLEFAKRHRISPPSQKSLSSALEMFQLRSGMSKKNVSFNKAEGEGDEASRGSYQSLRLSKSDCVVTGEIVLNKSLRLKWNRDRSQDPVLTVVLCVSGT